MTDAVASRNYRMGRLAFAVHGDDAVATCVHEELSAITSAAHDQPHLTFDFVDAALPAMPGYVRVPPFEFSETGFTAVGGGLSYQVRRDGTHLDVLLREPTFKRRVTRPPTLQRALHWNYLGPAERVAKGFFYEVFDYLTQVAQLPLGQTYLHASALERDGRAVALLAWGGVGKTSTMLRLVREDGWRYLSDDLAVVDADGVIWRSPKKLQIYAYNLQNDASLRAGLFRNRSLIDRVSWRWHHRRRGPSGVRRRVSAETILGPGRCGSSGRLAHAVLLERADVPRFEIVPLTAAQLANRATPVVMEEIQPFGRLRAAMQASGVPPILPSAGTVARTTRDVMLAAFAAAHVQLVRIPLAAAPEDVTSAVLDCVERPASSVA